MVPGPVSVPLRVPVSQFCRRTRSTSSSAAWPCSLVTSARLRDRAPARREGGGGDHADRPGGMAPAGRQGRMAATLASAECCLALRAMETPIQRKTTRLRALFAALGVACLLGGLSVAVGADRADSAPLRIIVLGKDAQAPHPDCPGKFQKTAGGDVTLAPCLAEGHITGFQISANGVNLPVRAPF